MTKCNGKNNKRGSNVVIEKKKETKADANIESNIRLKYSSKMFFVNHFKELILMN